MSKMAIIYKPGNHLAGPDEIFLSTDHPPLEKLQQWVGGYIQGVPMFRWFIINGKARTCVVWVDEDGKVKNLPFNYRATLLWESSIKLTGHSLRNAHGGFRDTLCGPCIIIIHNTSKDIIEWGKQNGLRTEEVYS